jgi:hypothetical protein
VPLAVPRSKWFKEGDLDEPARVPPIASLAIFESMAFARDPDADCSSMKVVWFQDENEGIYFVSAKPLATAGSPKGKSP